MNRRRVVATIAVAIALIGTCLWFLLRCSSVPSDIQPRPGSTPGQSKSQSPISPAPAGTIPTSPESQTSERKAFFATFLKPIAFVGRIVDEEGKPVSGAVAYWKANNNPNPYGTGTAGEAVSDDQGVFSIQSHGISLFVRVSKEGYYSIPTDLRGPRGSSGAFSNYDALGNTDSAMGTASTPTLFVLRKKGQTVPLLHVTERAIKIPRDGTPVMISLETGRIVPDSTRSLRVQCLTEDSKKDDQGHYPWQCRVSVPGGGLVVREDDYAFHAPLDGYQAEEDLGPKGTHWDAVAERQYFVATADGHFGRVKLRVRTGGDHFVVFESYFNPQSNSRNLEYGSP